MSSPNEDKQLRDSSKDTKHCHRQWHTRLMWMYYLLTNGSRPSATKTAFKNEENYMKVKQIIGSKKIPPSNRMRNIVTYSFWLKKSKKGW